MAAPVAQPRQTHTLRNIILAVVAGTVLVCGGCVVFFVWFPTTDAFKTTRMTELAATAQTQLARSLWTTTPSATVPTPIPTQTPTVTQTPTEMPTVTQTLPPLTATAAARATASAASPTPSETPTPTATTNPLSLGLSLTEFINKYNAMTDLQKQNYRDSLPGKQVNWSGKVVDVTGDGKIIVDIPNTLVSTVDLAGISNNVAVTVNKGSVIQFTGVIDNVVDFLGLHVYLVQCQIVK
jgi:hypothetical protein